MADFDGVALRVVRADHLAAIALSVGRAKDLARILEHLAARHGLTDAWKRFERRFLND